MRFFRMKIENIRTKERDTYISKHQGTAPAGWKCIGVLGYYDKPVNREEEKHEDD